VVAPLLQLKVYGEVPPLTESEIVPLLVPVHVTFVAKALTFKELIEPLLHESEIQVKLF
jgi:hypothetical protein